MIDQNTLKQHQDRLEKRLARLRKQYLHAAGLYGPFADATVKFSRSITKNEKALDNLRQLEVPLEAPPIDQTTFNQLTAAPVNPSLPNEIP